MKIGRLGHTTGRGIHSLARAAAWVAGVCVVIMMFLTFADVFGRYLFGLPIKGVHDVTILMMVVMSFLAFGYAQITQTHVTVNVVTSRLSKHTNSMLSIFTHLFGIGVYGVMSWALATRAWGYLATPEKAPVSLLLLIPHVPFIFVAAGGSAILCLVLIVDFARSIGEAMGR